MTKEYDDSVPPGDWGNVIADKNKEIEKLTADNARLRALAKFGEWCLDELGHDRLTHEEYECHEAAVRFGVYKYDIGDGIYEPTDLAKLPEGVRD